MNRHVSVLSIVLVFALAVASAAQSATTSPSQEVSVPRLVKFSGTVRREAGHARSGVVGIETGSQVFQSRAEEELGGKRTKVLAVLRIAR